MMITTVQFFKVPSPKASWLFAVFIRVPGVSSNKTGDTSNTPSINVVSIILKILFRNGLPRNPNAYGPLTDGKDFTFLDGRPTPIGVGQKKRIEKHKAFAVSVNKNTLSY